MATGTIARLVIDKEFGFIRDESGTEHCFHRGAGDAQVSGDLGEPLDVHLLEFTNVQSGARTLPA